MNKLHDYSAQLKRIQSLKKPIEFEEPEDWRAAEQAKFTRKVEESNAKFAALEAMRLAEKEAERERCLNETHEETWARCQEEVEKENKRLRAQQAENRRGEGYTVDFMLCGVLGVFPIVCALIFHETEGLYAGVGFLVLFGAYKMFTWNNI